MAHILTGPSLEPRSGKARQLVVILHGFGADGNDLIDLGREWGAVLPDAAFVAPHAHEPCEHMPSGRQWFRLTDRNPHERWSGALSAGPVIDAFIDAELASRGLDDSNLALVGFSQGAMMALHVGLRRRARPAGVLAYSGLLIGPEHLPEAVAGRSADALPPIFLVHGSHDEVVPPDSLFISAAHIAAAGGSCQWHLSLGLAHGIDGAGLTQGAVWLARSFGLPYPAALAPGPAPRRGAVVS
ncbi:MAG: phospholipase [Hyphomicrobiales bacterium]|jgi:phospholipase/carboxylesterase|nr:phospholipase [Hyphomicrobiales bacterium]